MAIKTRIENIEKQEAPKKTAIFFISDGLAEGRAWWRDDLRWKDLSKPEFEKLEAELEKEGVEVMTMHIVSAGQGENSDGWDKVVLKSPAEIVEEYDNQRTESERLSWNAAAAKRKAKRKSFGAAE